MDFSEREIEREKREEKRRKPNLLLVHTNLVTDIHELEFVPVTCDGRNCSTKCWGLEDWAEPVICSAQVPIVATYWTIGRDLIEFGVQALQLVLLLAIIIFLCVCFRHRTVIRQPPDELGWCSQCHRTPMIRAPLMATHHLSHRRPLAPSTVYTQISLDEEV